MLLTSGKPGGLDVCHMADLSIEQRLRLYGRGYYEPLWPVVAGEFVTLTLATLLRHEWGKNPALG
jgi:hypothetical protein